MLVEVCYVEVLLQKQMKKKMLNRVSLASKLKLLDFPQVKE